MTDISNSELTAEQRAAGLMKLSHQMMTQYHERRSLEWRMHALLWTLLVVGAYFVGTATVHVPPLRLWAWVMVVFVCHVVWTLKMQMNQVQDQEMSRNYREAAESILLESQPSLASIVRSSERTETRYALPPWMTDILTRYWVWNVVIAGTTGALAIGLVVVALAPRDTRAQTIVDLQRQVNELTREQNTTVSELRSIRAEVSAVAKPVAKATVPAARPVASRTRRPPAPRTTRR